MDRNCLKGKEGDSINALLAGCGFTIRKLLWAILPVFGDEVAETVLRRRLAALHLVPVPRWLGDWQSGATFTVSEVYAAPAIAPIDRRDPARFTSNLAALFLQDGCGARALFFQTSGTTAK